MVLLAGLSSRSLTAFSLWLCSIVAKLNQLVKVTQHCISIKFLKIGFVSRGLGFFVSEQWRKVEVSVLNL